MVSNLQLASQPANPHVRMLGTEIVRANGVPIAASTSLVENGLLARFLHKVPSGSETHGKVVRNYPDVQPLLL